MVDIDPDPVNQVPGLLEMSNPRGENFQKWADGQVLNTYSEIIGKVMALKNKKALPNTVRNVPLNDKQRLCKDIVCDYVKKWSNAKDHGGTWPEPLRLVLMGSPGTGKSTLTRSIMDTLMSLLGAQFTDYVRQATPTGCASFQMSSSATTSHQLFGLSISPTRDLKPHEIKFLHENSNRAYAYW